MGARRRSNASRERSSRPETAPPGPPPIALVLIDDNRLLREGLTAMIHTQPGFKVLAASADANEALQKVREAKPDVVLLDFGLEDHDSLSLTMTVRAEVPRPRHRDGAAAGAGGCRRLRAGGGVRVHNEGCLFRGLLRDHPRGGRGRGGPSTGADQQPVQPDRQERASNGKAKVMDAVRLTKREREVIDLLGEGAATRRSRPGSTSPCTR